MTKKLKDNEFFCEECENIFPKARTDEEAMVESRALHGYIPPKQLAIVCDDCFNKLKHKWKK